MEGVYSWHIGVMLLIASLKMEGIVKWSGLKSQGPMAARRLPEIWEIGIHAVFSWLSEWNDVFVLQICQSFIQFG